MNTSEETVPEYPSGSGKEKFNVRQRLWEVYTWACFWGFFIIFFFVSALFLPLCFMPLCWPFCMLYLIWMHYDRDTPHACGRKINFFRKLSSWYYVRNYFPIRLVKTAELSPDTTYIFPSFPHGMLAFGTVVNFGSNVNNFDEVFTDLNPYLTTLSANFNLPFTRELLLWSGACASSEKSILSILKGSPGNVCVLLVGGIAEALKTLPGTYTLVLKNRKGFIRLGLKAGSSLVPVFSFGETDTFNQLSGKWYWRVQRKLKSATGLPFVITKGRCILSQSLSILPFKVPITTVVGKPIKLPKVENPSDELVNKFHKKFISELVDLFNKYKGKYDIAGENATLCIE